MIGQYNIQIVKGDTFEFIFNLSDKDCETDEITPVDLSSITSVESAITDKSNNVIQTITAAVTDASRGEVTLSLTALQTDALEGATTRQTENIGNYYVTMAAGLDNTTVLKGKVSLTSLKGL